MADMVKDGSTPTLGEAARFLFTDEERAKIQKNVTEARIEQARYLGAHKEIDEIVSIAMARLLRAQPADAEGWLTDFFADNDLEAVVQAEREAVAERARISRETGEETLKTLF